MKKKTEDRSNTKVDQIHLNIDRCILIYSKEFNIETIYIKFVCSSKGFVY